MAEAVLTTTTATSSLTSTFFGACFSDTASATSLTARDF